MTATAIATVERAPRSLLADMSARYGMEPAPFEATLRATVCKGNVSREELAAFLLVAKEYRLNPLTKEIYAFPAKGGGIQPILSIDGWCRIINEHPQLDGIEFDDIIEDGNLMAVTCRLYRKDRARASSVTEYMSECRRSTDVWKQWPARMLRHKALIQCARYAFGFSGIVDQDEYERQVQVVEVERPGLTARLSGPPAEEGFNATRAEEAAVEIEHGAQTDEIVGTVEQRPADAHPGERVGTFDPVEGAAELPVERETSDYDSPAEWLADARRWIADAEDSATVAALNKNWEETGRWLALRAYSATDHADFLAEVKARFNELKAAEEAR